MKLYSTYLPEANKDISMDSSMSILSSDFASYTLLPINDNTFPTMEYPQLVDPMYSDFPCENMVYPVGSKDYMRVYQSDDYPTLTWKCKKMHEWNGEDILDCIVNMANNKDIDISRLSLCSFRDVRGIELVQMSKSDFIHKIKPDFDLEPNTESAGEILYEEMKMLENKFEQDSVVPTVLDSHNYEEKYLHSSDNPQLIDLDDHRKQVAIDSFMQCDSGYASRTEEQELKVEERTYYDEQDLSIDNNLPVMITKRPPGRPKGSGKKPQKRVKNVSVPEFLRDLLHDRNYCPRIIKWEDYSRGKFRFNRPDEVARLWGLKKNNKKMSFEKFSRAMRYHYKQGVLVSVPSARLVYQFGPKAPSYFTPNPNFECETEFSMR